MKKLFILSFLSLGVTLHSCAQSGSARVISETEYATALKNKEVLLIDVRTPEEFSEGHLPNAINIDVRQADFAEKIKEYQHKDEVFIYCKSGSRSQKASEIMHKVGFKKITDLEGGFSAWNGPVDR